MLSETGKLKGDLTVINWGDGTFWIEGSYYLRGWHMRWFARSCARGRLGARHLRRRDRLLGVGAEVARVASTRDASGRIQRRPAIHGRDDLDVGLVRAKVARLSVTGELGYEINCRALEAGTLRKTLLRRAPSSASRSMATTRCSSLRLEKSFGIWSAEFTQAYTPRMTGMDRWIAWDKGEFVGKKAALAEREGPRLRTCW